MVTHIMHHQYQERVLYITLIFVSWLKISDKQTTFRNSECNAWKKHQVGSLNDAHYK